MTMSCYAEIFLKRCSSMFLLPWFLWFFISILLQICFSVQCPWFILNFCFVLPSTVRYDSVTVLLRCKSLVSFLTHDVPQLDPACKPLASCVPCVGLWWRHARVCASCGTRFVGFLKASGWGSFHQTIPWLAYRNVTFVCPSFRS